MEGQLRRKGYLKDTGGTRGSRQRKAQKVWGLVCQSTRSLTIMDHRSGDN
jgi:hypothetical protein